MHDDQNLIPSHGGYRNLKAYQMAEIVYDATVRFCNRFIDKRSRTHDQMVQAARSGKQNIAEGSMASGTSKKIELKLIGIARASLEELLLDFEDYLRQKGLPQTNYLLDRQLRVLEKAFLKKGGFTERMYQARSRARQWSKTR